MTNDQLRSKIIFLYILIIVIKLYKIDVNMNYHFVVILWYTDGHPSEQY